VLLYNSTESFPTKWKIPVPYVRKWLKLKIGTQHYLEPFGPPEMEEFTSIINEMEVALDKAITVSNEFMKTFN
jgi:hypothetical protein